MSHWPGSAHNQLTSFGQLSRSELMSRVRSKGNSTTEMLMVQLLRGSRINGWRRHASLIGRPDFVWPRSRLVVFIDGCFWHGHSCGRNLTPKTNAGLWEKKIRATRKRDRRNNRALTMKGWKVIRVWECTLAKHPKHCLSRISIALTECNSESALSGPH